MKILVLFGVSAFAVTAGAQLSLTPSVSEREQEGIKFSQLEFSDAGRRVTYEQPRGWIFSSPSNRKIVFCPREKPQVQAAIEAGFPLIPAQFDEEGVKQLKVIVLSLLPKDSEQVETAGEQKNPVLINGRETYEVTVRFVNHGQRFQRSVLFVNLESEQLRCKVMAPTDDFEKAHSAFITSLYGMQWSR